MTEIIDISETINARMKGQQDDAARDRIATRLDEMKDNEWSPREALTTVIEMIDLGDIDPTNMAVIFTEDEEDDDEVIAKLNYFVSRTNKCDVLAMVTSLHQQILHNWF
jgi:hypothetical protein